MSSDRLLYRDPVQSRSLVGGVLLLLTLLSGCSDVPEIVDGGVSIPGVGSMFTTQVVQQVGADSPPVQTSMKFSVQVTDMIMEGKERVVQFAADTLVTLIAYETNGDLSLYMEPGAFGRCPVSAGWLRVPFGGEADVNDTLLTTEDCILVWSARPLGVESVIINGLSLKTQKVVAELRADELGEEAGFRCRKYTLWYAPELGYVVREHLIGLEGDNEQVDTIGTSQRELSEYTLKK
ncbi:MAG: hypothetical protein KDD67_15175 [Ignavibacteriae bacterium]|nr:hypothetical protein [Ignavibacteriota bacterium]MCB9217559.1 hypothetical protein [Ignavibacteria bacterium]